MNVTNGKVDVNALRRRIGIVFQAFNLFPHMTVLQNITLAPRKTRGLSKQEAEAKAHELLGRIGLSTRPTSSRIGCRAGSSSGSRSCARWRWTRS